MSSREAILGKVRRALGSAADDAARLQAVEKRLARPLKGVTCMFGTSVVAPAKSWTRSSVVNISVLDGG